MNRTKRSLFLVFSSAFLLSAYGQESFTNLAGHVIVGRVNAINVQSVSFGSRQLPLSIFPKSEQARLFLAGNRPDLALSICHPHLARDLAVYQAQWARASALYRQKVTSEADLKKIGRALQGAWQKSLDRLPPSLQQAFRPLLITTTDPF